MAVPLDWKTEMVFPGDQRVCSKIQGNHFQEKSKPGFRKGFLSNRFSRRSSGNNGLVLYVVGLESY